jgi:hypothetical protein
MKKIGRNDPERRSALAPEDFADLVMDNAQWHLDTLREKNLPVDEITAYNHLAIYLRYCIEHELMADWFVRQYAATTRAVQEHPADTDLRPFLRDELHGILMRGFFGEEGTAFAEYYYDGDAPSFPSDIDNHALAYFGAEQYFSEEFDDEAYLFYRLLELRDAENAADDSRQDSRAASVGGVRLSAVRRLERLSRYRCADGGVEILA